MRTTSAAGSPPPWTSTPRRRLAPTCFCELASPSVPPRSALYKHLYGFFSRYGDIVSKRRYSRRERYAIPYNGEEVHLHWHNEDQHYVKTGEHFHDYAFKAGQIILRFRVADAHVEQGNVKGEKRYFFPRLAEAEWRNEAWELHVPFEFRTAMATDKALAATTMAPAVARTPTAASHWSFVPGRGRRCRPGRRPRPRGSARWRGCWR